MAGLLGAHGAARPSLLAPVARARPGSAEWYMSLLSSRAAPQSADTYEQGVFDEGDAQLLQSQIARGSEALPAPSAPAAPQAPAVGLLGSPQRRRVNPGRVLSRFIFGGEDPFQAADAERARLDAEAMAPMIQMQREAALSAITDPRERALFLGLGGEDWQKNVGEQFAPQVIAPGGIQSVIGSRETVGAPSFGETGDLTVRRDPITGVVSPVFQRPASFSEETARINAENPVALGPGDRLVNQRSGNVVASGAPRLTTVSEGADLYDEGGNLIAANAPEPRPGSQGSTAAQEQARETMANNLQTGLAGARRYVDAAGVWSQYNPLQRQDRANLSAHLDSLKGNITFDQLMEMKRNSPNGASGLGAMSDNEARLLASTVAALDVDMSPEELGRSFQIIDRLVAKLRQPASGGTVSVTSPAEAQALQPGTRYRTPDGQEYIR